MKTYFFFFFFSMVLISTSAQKDACNWTFQTGGRIYSSPVLANELLLFGSGDSVFYALNKNTGQKEWSFKSNGSIQSSPSVFEELVFFSNAEGWLFALNCADGTLKWKFKAKSEKMQDIWDYYQSSPKVYQGNVYWGSADGNLYVLDALKGTITWKFKSEGIIHANPLLIEGKVYFGDFNGWFYALDAFRGNLIWKFRTVGDTYFPNGEIQKTASYDQGVLYFGSRDFNVYALDAKTGRGRWNRKELGSWVIASPIVYKENIYFGTSDTHAFYCLAKTTGKVIWRIPVPMRVYGEAVAKDGLIYFGCFDGILRAVDATNGELKWKFQTKASKTNYANIYTSDGKFKENFELYGKDYLESEEKIHSLGSILSTPLIDQQNIYFGSSDGAMYSVSTQSIQEK